MAATIHANSSRSNGPFVAIDCAALPENLLESELFGHERGAFTGAEKSRHGLLKGGDDGTVFLDEVGDLPLPLQPKLLRTLQERQLRRLGGEEMIPIDIRVIAATNQDLEDMVRRGEFREELFYRLNVINLEVPPLRERGQDILLLAHQFLREFSEQYHKHLNSFSPEVSKRLLAHAWPGNVRELRNVVERAVLLAPGTTIQSHDLPDSLFDDPVDDARSWKSLQSHAALAVEKPFLVDLLKRHRGNVSSAATEAQVPRKVIYRLAGKFGLNIDSFREH